MVISQKAQERLLYVHTQPPSSHPSSWALETTRLICAYFELYKILVDERRERSRIQKRSDPLDHARTDLEQTGKAAETANRVLDASDDDDETAGEQRGAGREGPMSIREDMAALLAAADEIEERDLLPSTTMLEFRTTFAELERRTRDAARWSEGDDQLQQAAMMLGDHLVDAIIEAVVGAHPKVQAAMKAFDQQRDLPAVATSLKCSRPHVSKLLDKGVGALGEATVGLPAVQDLLTSRLEELGLRARAARLWPKKL